MLTAAAPAGDVSAIAAPASGAATQAASSLRPRPAGGRTPTARPLLVVAGVSVRALAESARQGGWDVIGLDLFGDLDTRRACRRWLSIGDAATLSIDAARLRACLAALADEPGVVGWVAGSGFEAAPALLAAGGERLPLRGTAGPAVAALRDAQRFFALLDELRLAHPAISLAAPADPRGWLAKRAGGCGGWHIRAAADAHTPTPDTYYQRFKPGVPMSALFLADGQRAQAVALNRLIVQRHGDRPHVYAGAIGPIDDAALQRRVQHALDALVPAFALHGLASLDFIASHGVPWLLEINPRPSASMLLHHDAWPDGLLHAHVQAVLGRLPAAAPQHPSGVRGSRIVFASRRCRIDASLLERLACSADCHDLPAAPAPFAEGEPVCSVSAEAGDAERVERVLARRCADVVSHLIEEPEEIVT